jgi:hypothetical protein
MTLALLVHFEPSGREAAAEIRTKSGKDVAEILASDRVAYYTEMLAVLTAALIGTGGIQSLLIGRQIALARDEFSATHRPQLVVREVEFVDDGPRDTKRFQFIVYNSGASAAIIVSCRFYVSTVRDGLTFPSSVELNPPELLNLEMEPGAGKEVTLPADLSWGDIFNTTAVAFWETDKNGVPTIRPFFGGKITYCDRRGRLRRTLSFEREYLIAAQRFGPGNPEREYEA